MNTEYRYIFEKGSKKHPCPNCGKKRFVRYIDTKAGKHLPDQYGRCDRESKCGYYLNPYQDGYVKSIWEQERGNKTDWKPQQSKRIRTYAKKRKIVFIPFEVLNNVRTGYEHNAFIQNLLTRVAFPFGIQDIENVISMYHLGTIQNGYRAGANAFPFIDIKGNIRAVQVKQFNDQNHTTGTDFLHSIIEKHHTKYKKPLPKWLEAYNKNDIKVSCLFGEHLLYKYPYNPVALVEAPKTAIYGTLYFGFPEKRENLLWLAVYNLSSLTLDKCRSLKGRNIYLFPDLSKDGRAFNLWSRKANEIQKGLRGTYFHVSDLLEKIASQQDKDKGKDLADFIITQDWRRFREQNIQEQTKISPVPVKKKISNDICTLRNALPLQSEDKLKVKNVSMAVTKQDVEAWTKDIVVLEKFFSSVTLPTQPIRFNNFSVINDFSYFIKNHLSIIKSNKGNSTFLPYLNRLKETKNLIAQGKQINITSS